MFQHPFRSRHPPRAGMDTVPLMSPVPFHFVLTFSLLWSPNRAVNVEHGRGSRPGAPGPPRVCRASRGGAPAGRESVDGPVESRLAGALRSRGAGARGEVFLGGGARRW